jgi:hypothetical protein
MRSGWCDTLNAGQTWRISVKLIPLNDEAGLGGSRPAAAAQAVPAEDQALLDAYSRAVIDVVTASARQWSASPSVPTNLAADRVRASS